MVKKNRHNNHNHQKHNKPQQSPLNNKRERSTSSTSEEVSVSDTMEAVSSSTISGKIPEKILKSLNIKENINAFIANESGADSSNISVSSQIENEFNFLKDGDTTSQTELVLNTPPNTADNSSMEVVDSSSESNNDKEDEQVYESGNTAVSTSSDYNDPELVDIPSSSSSNNLCSPDLQESDDNEIAAAGGLARSNNANAIDTSTSAGPISVSGLAKEKILVLIPKLEEKLDILNQTTDIVSIK